MHSMMQATFPDWQEEPGNGRDENDWVVLRVGGQVFETSRQTLCADRKSMLAALVLRHLGKDDKNNKNSVIRIDRDGQRFAHVLNYLRSGTVWLQDVGLLRELQEEAEFFCLAGLSALCEEEIQRIEEAEEAMWRKNIEILKEEVKKCLGEAILEKFGGGGEVFSVLRAPPRLGRLGLRCGGEQQPEFRLDADF
uniref:BTB domain-containing protein n=1 Tax=Picea sitchensis TaxID=3332 RepID=A9NZH3_PICSI|nr:unknown [Picea sitchensis]